MFYQLAGAGSSPLTRGKLSIRRALIPMLGLIPAHAGKTWTRGNAGAPRRAHPRSRGENASMRMDVSSELGSSPLTRGKLEADRIASSPNRLIPAHAGKTHAGAGRGAVGGLIPAHAGKTRRDFARRPAHRAHPRSRGENKAAPRVAAVAEGSSPLTRGKPPTPTPLSPLKRLIPAHAGKTIVSRPRTFGWWAHPRSRGENVPTKQ